MVSRASNSLLSEMFDLLTYLTINGYTLGFPKFPVLTNAQKPYFFARNGSNLASDCRPFARLELGGWVGGSLKKPLSLKVRPRSTRKPSAHYVKRQKFPKFPVLTNAQKPYFFARNGSNLASDCRPFARLELPPPWPRDRARNAPRFLYWAVLLYLAKTNLGSGLQWSFFVRPLLPSL